ncbi:DUF2235 domain-containing protein [Trujillonella endophytica]|uniref:Uncharacterized alpha/beta hydrolase domain n=1 Tax=Trujillonella endophytica TaxID=673521 RepID=A0A1H8V962_9ACTN|nr:DUF2235 domain-containing protein [Trujillella endophytica]SEP11992.1 Uncharacterized alpha/beta hydrolase domain [Trujillella endophytica]
MRRNLAAFLDGTWSDDNTNTNVVQIHGRVPDEAPGVRQERCYVRGVGTGVSDRLMGGAFGVGVEENIRRAYDFLAERYESADDHIHLIGYSRGAFTARSLAGMIAKCGLISAADLPAEAVFRRYRDTAAPGLRELQQGEARPRTAQDELLLARSRLVRIRFLGVFDTVGALGIPGGLGRWLTRRRYEFHNTNLSGLVDVACHAVALDERRGLFMPTMWTSVPVPMPDHPTSVEQRWFVGGHTNVGGGGTRDPQRRNPLSVVTREWIVERAVEAGLVVDPPSPAPTGEEWNGRIDDWSSTLLGRLAGLLPGNRRRSRPVRETVAETLDPGVLHRWGTGDPPYLPRNPHLEPWVRSLL